MALPRPGPNARPSPADHETTTTSFLLSNLHCPTCVTAIKAALAESCPGQIRWVSPNVVTSVVTVEHEPAASLRRMHDALEEAGFEVCGITTSATHPTDLDLDPAMAGNGEGSSSSHSQPTGRGGGSALMRWMTSARLPAAQTSDSRRAHLLNCEQCRRLGDKGHETNEKLPPKEMTVEYSGLTLDKTGTSGSETTMATQPLVAIHHVDAAPAPRWRVTLAVGGMTCAACANMITESLAKRDWVANVVVNLLGNSAAVDVYDRERADDVVDAIEELGYEATPDQVVSVDGERPRNAASSDLWRATLAVGGMTCASCANTITKELKKRTWIKDVTVNLLTNSATVELRGRSHADELVDAIEDLGFEAALDTVVSLAEEEAPESHERTVEIRISGLYCDNCPSRVANSLGGFRRQLQVLGQPTRQRPIIKVAYVPDAPRFTVRHILAAIEASDPGFSAAIYHPPTLEERSKLIQKQHQFQILWRVILTGIICIPTFIIGIVYMSLAPDSHSKHYLMEPWTAGLSRAQIALFILATPAYFFAADLFHRRAFREIWTLWRSGSRVPVLQRFYRFGSMNTLMSLGTTIAYISSVSQMVAAAVHQPDEVDDLNFYFDSVVFLTFFLLLGRLIESYSKSRTGDAVEMLGRLRPTTAVLVDGYGTEKSEDIVVQADVLDFGDVVRIAHGASPPADGRVVQGDTTFDESSLTGESRPVKKAIGDNVFAGTVNKGGAVLAQITGELGRSLLDQIVTVVREGQTKRAPIEQIADLMTSYFVPVVVLVAILTWIVWLSLGLAGRIPGHFLDVTSGGWVAYSLQFAISVFVVACPCGLALAAPTAIFVGGGLAASHGILAKGGGEAFEKASRIDCVVFDKTGTLTAGGEPSITDCEVLATEQKDEVLGTLRALEENSSHPIAKAIVSYCAASTESKATIEDVEELPGKGMKATARIEVSESTPFEMIVGNEALMQDYSVPMSDDVGVTLRRWQGEAKSIALVAIKGLSHTSWSLAAALAISDPVRPEARAIVTALQSRGTSVYMLSGDNPTTAAAVAAKVGIPADHVMAGVLPTGKAAKITYLQSALKAGNSATQRARVAMVGDGINDSPALATADVGVAIGSGSDVAISSADFVLVKSDLRGIVDLMDLSALVFRRIKINFGWAVVYNCLALPVAAGVLYPVVSNGNHVRLDPVWASLAMALSSISVVLSSLSLRSRGLGLGFRPRKIVVE